MYGKNIRPSAKRAVKKYHSVNRDDQIARPRRAQIFSLFIFLFYRECGSMPEANVLRVASSLLSEANYSSDKCAGFGTYGVGSISNRPWILLIHEYAIRRVRRRQGFPIRGFILNSPLFWQLS